MLDTTIPADPFSQRLVHIRQLIEEGKLREAALALNQAQKEAPADARVPLVGMRLADAAGNLKGAIQTARRALALAPGWPVAQLELARLLVRTGDAGQTQEALELARQARATDPDHAQLAVGAVNVAHAAHDEALALQWAEQALERLPSHAGLHLFAGQLLIWLGRDAQALPYLRQAHDLMPGQTAPLLALLQCARALGDEEAARAWADQALALAPQDQEVGYWHALAHGRTLQWAEEELARHPGDARLHLFAGQLLVKQKCHAQALPHLRQAHDLDPGQTVPLLALLQCARALGDEEAARAWAGQALALAPRDEQVRYWHAIAHGQTPATQPAVMAQTLFDGYSVDFDGHLAGTLHYRAPERIAALLREKFPDRRFNLLDLGCGTGLVGACLGRIEGHIIGVDLSQRMIDQAARRGVYSRFHRVNILDALAETPGDHYEAIACADALVYVGDLAPVIPNALRVLKAGGWFLFTCEAAQADEGDPAAGLVLRASNRYAHRAADVEQQLRAAGFANVTLEPLPELRLENDAPLAGFLAVAQKPAAG